jgi:hypothetical protein
MKIFKTLGSLAGLLLLVGIFLNACAPIRNLNNPPSAWQGDSNFASITPDHFPAKKKCIHHCRR